VADKQTDEEIAEELRTVTGELHITEQEMAIWRGMEGYDKYEGFALNRLYGVGTRRLQQIARKVRVRILERRAHIAGGFVRFGHSIAQGSKVRFAQDGTPTGKIPGSSWNEERLKASHAGNQRKPARPVPTKRKKSA
jgi:hypothetical protein